jgi:hypothetical protein
MLPNLLIDEANVLRKWSAVHYEPGIWVSAYLARDASILV